MKKEKDIITTLEEIWTVQCQICIEYLNTYFAMKPTKADMSVIPGYMKLLKESIGLRIQYLKEFSRYQIEYFLKELKSKESELSLWKFANWIREIIEDDCLNNLRLLNDDYYIDYPTEVFKNVRKSPDILQEAMKYRDKTLNKHNHSTKEYIDKLIIEREHKQYEEYIQKLKAEAEINKREKLIDLIYQIRLYLQ